MAISNLTWLIIFSFIYIIVLSFLYFSKERINNGENKIYKYLLITNLIGLVLQFLCDSTYNKWFYFKNVPCIFHNIYIFINYLFNRNIF